MSKQIAIIGGGAAGMMAAARIHELAPEYGVVLFEKNAVLGRKVVISGGGRCNVTTGIKDVRQLLQRYMRGEKFLTSAMWNFPPDAVYDWFEQHGVPLKMEADMRVFPQSNDGKDVVAVFEKIFLHSNIDVRVRTAVLNIHISNASAEANTSANGFTIESRGSTNGSTNQMTTEQFDAVIITTGGQAYRHTGSTGDGYSFAEALGHTITPLAASLNAFVLAEDWIKELPGVSFTDIELTADSNATTILTHERSQSRLPAQSHYSARGPMVCTHTGISGPVVFALSAQIAFEEYSKKQPLALYINWLPENTADTLRAHINRACDQTPKKLLWRLLQDWLPKSVAIQLLRSVGLNEDSVLAEVSKEIRIRIGEALQHTVVHIVGRSAGSEFVTAGGVSTDEIDPSTMQSRIVPGLFFAGEIMNVDGITGGFNLQASWAAGRLAGESAL